MNELLREKLLRKIVLTPRSLDAQHAAPLVNLRNLFILSFRSGLASKSLIVSFAVFLAATPARLVAQSFPTTGLKDFSDAMIETPNTAMTIQSSEPVTDNDSNTTGPPAPGEQTEIPEYRLDMPETPTTEGSNYEGPVGVQGIFNGNVQTGCSYDPLSHSAHRQIEDIAPLAGSVGKYPLKLTRYYNSRSPYGVGLGPGWSHEYSWAMSQYGTRVYYPNGNIHDALCGLVKGASDYWETGPDGNGNGTWRLADGGKVEFENRRLKYIYDPYNQRTDITYGTGWMKVKEPGGRYLKFNYTADVYPVLDNVEAYDGPQNHLIERVVYNHTWQSTGGNNITRVKMLTTVNYDDNQHATYTYRTDNVPNDSLGRISKTTPLLATCDDVRYQGAMRQIAYEYYDGTAHGVIWKEEKSANGVTVSKVEPEAPLYLNAGQYPMPNEFTETRGGDGPHRKFHYTDLSYRRCAANETCEPCDTILGDPDHQMLQWYEDFKQQRTDLHYDPNWYIDRVTDANGNVTTYERGNPPPAGIGEIITITHPAGVGYGASSIHYDYYPDRHYIRSITDERSNETYIWRDANHRITKIDYKDDQGQILAYEEFQYDAFGFGKVTAHHLKNGAWESFAYDNRGLLTDKWNPKQTGIPGGTDPHTHYDYYTSADGKPGWIDRVKKMTGPAPNWSLSEQASETYEYDMNASTQPCAGRGLVTKMTHADNTYQSSKYDQWGNKLKEWNELGERTDYVYDSYKRVTSVTRGSETTIYDYSPTEGNATQSYKHTTNSVYFITSPTLIKTHNVYDENFRMTSSTAAFGTSKAATTWFHYDAIGNQDCVTDPRGSGPCSSPLSAWPYTTRTEYDTRNRKWHVWDAQDHRTTFTYDQTSNVRFIERPDVSTEERRYDALNRMIRDIMPYKSGSSPVNLVTILEYDPSGTIHKATLSNDDPNDPNPNHWTMFGYDASDRRTTMTYQNNQTQSWAFDDAGNMKTRTTVNGETLYFGYDNRNRKYGESWWDPNAEWRYFALDAASRLRRATNGIGLWWSNFISDVHRNYDYAGRVYLDQQAVTGLETKNVYYEYDIGYGGGDGKPTRMHVTPAPNPSFDYDFRYDEMGRFEKILAHGNNNAQFQYYYDPASNENRRQNLLNGVDQYYNPDSLNRPTTADLFHNGSRFARESYDYDGMGRLHAVTRLDNRQDQFGYYRDGELFWVMYGVSGVLAPDLGQPAPAEDPDKEKTPEDYLSLSGWDPNLALTADHTVTYVYDKAGNRTRVADTGPNGDRTYTPNTINQYTAMQGGTISNGPEHEINSYQAPNQNQAVTYTYMKDEHLIRAASTSTYDLAYDALGRCVKRTVDGVAKYYTYDGERPILEYGVIGNLRGKNLYGKGIDEILMRWDGTVQSPNPQTFYYQQDHEGSVTHLTMQPDQNGNVILERYRYDAFGTPTIYNKDWTILTASAVSNRFLFTGREYNATFGFYEYRARAYHPGLGRFMSEDPKLFVRRAGLGKGSDDWSFGVHPDEAEFNLFRYCGNDPVDFTDPMGLFDVGFEGYGTPTWSGGTRDTVGNVALREYIASRHGQVFDRTQLGQHQALAAIRAALAKNPQEPINITGYSRGAKAANDVATKAGAEGISIRHEILIDPVKIPGRPQSLTVAGNVQRADNYYQHSGGPFHGGPAANPSSSVVNHDLSGPGVNHNTVVQRAIHFETVYRTGSHIPDRIPVLGQ